MKNTFLDAVSHELRTPLAAIVGIGLTLEHKAEYLADADRSDLYTRLVANARKLDRLLNDLLDLDRLTHGIVAPKRRPTDVAALAARIADDWGLPNGRRPQVEAQPLTVSLDPGKVERIIENLLANAARHTPPDTPVWVRVTQPPGGDGVLLAVEDAGGGVPAELRDSVFEPFRQGPGAPTHAPGVGIGLTLVARFAELHGGRALVEERAGGGSSFRVLDPGRPRKADHPRYTAERPQPSPREGMGGASARPQRVVPADLRRAGATGGGAGAQGEGRRARARQRPRPRGHDQATAPSVIRLRYFVKVPFRARPGSPVERCSCAMTTPASTASEPRTSTTWCPAPWRASRLGERRRRLPALQQPEGGPPPPRGRLPPAARAIGAQGDALIVIAVGRIEPGWAPFPAWRPTPSPPEPPPARIEGTLAEVEAPEQARSRKQSRWPTRAALTDLARTSRPWALPLLVGALGAVL